ncbi:MAG: peptidylprolyl isomerase, partial [Burkholderiaceae bacterium]|nr:peptidylprolyl isomerase [Burkholderiaceae bacterium]
MGKTMNLRLSLVLAALCGILGPVQGALAQAAAPAASAPSATETAPAKKQRVKTELVDSIAVVVNDDVITKNDLDQRMAFVEKNMRAQNVPMPPPEEFRKQVIERMIIERCQLQTAKEDGIRVDDLTLDRAMARIAESNKMSPQQFRDQIEHEGTPYGRFRETIRDEILMQRVREREVDSRIQPSQAEIDNYIAAQTGTGAAASYELDLAHILVGIPENASAEQIAARRNKAEDLLRQLKAGADFTKIAATYSDASDALQGGDLGWRNQDRLPQLFLDAVGQLKEGEISSVVKSANGFHIVKLVGKRTASPLRGGSGAPAAPAGVVQTHARHILIKVNQVVTDVEAKRKLNDLRERLLNKSATFEELAKLYSNDLSATKGGDIGWVYPGDTAPEFEKAMDALQVGEISEPVQTQYGFHLIQVVERKTDDVSKERQRLLATAAIRERKMEEATQDWMRSLR